MNVPSNTLRQVEDKILETYLRAEKLFARTFELPTIQWDLRGLCAGKALCRANCIRLNPVLLCANTEDFIRQTVPHEVAHLVNRALNGGAVKPHGPEWRAIMRAFGLAPLRCHNYDVEPTASRTQERHAYYCLCRIHQISQTKHNRIRRGFIYRCRHCGVSIVHSRASLPVAAKSPHQNNLP